MSVDVTVLRVFTDARGDFGNALGVVDAAHVAPPDRQRLAYELGYSETVFVELPAAGAATAHAIIYTPLSELPFAGHPTVGATWWLRRHGFAVDTLRVPAGSLRVSQEGELTGVRARAAWGPELAIHELPSVGAVLEADAADFAGHVAHYVWAWADRTAGSLRARMFAENLGVPEDEATESAALRLTDHLRRDLRITQGKGSVIETEWSPDGWLRVVGRVVDDGVRRVD